MIKVSAPALVPLMKIFACALLLAVCGLGQAQTYLYFTFDPPSSANTAVNGMNNAGQIVGSYLDAAGGTHNFLRSADGATTTDAINNLGQIVGNYIDASSGGFRSYIRSADGSTFTPFDIPDFGPGGGPKGISDNGVITGSVVAASASAAWGFVRGADGTFTTINMSAAGIRPVAIDNSGDIAGWYIAGGSEEGLTHGFLRSPAGAITTFDLPGTDNG